MSDQLNPGDRSDAIALIANTLIRLGFLTNPSDLYDEKLTQGIKAFQQERGLTATGIINDITKRALEEARFKLGDRVLSFSPTSIMRGDDVEELEVEAGNYPAFYNQVAEAIKGNGDMPVPVADAMEVARLIDVAREMSIR